jgi:hypothetical protein
MNPARDEGVLLFVDALEDDDAWLLVGDKRHRVPRAILPPEACEGSWLRLSLGQAPPEAKSIEGHRAQLLRSDPGGKVKL